MALWGKLDNLESTPKFVDLDNYPVGTRLVFVDATEASITVNKARGLNSPGWWLYREYTDGDSVVRHKAEQLVAFSSSVTPGLSGDTAGDDDILKDFVIAFTTSPVDTTVVDGATAQFTVVTNPATGVTYQWQESTDGITFVDVANGAVYSNVTTTTLSVVSSAALDQNEYRVVVTSTGGQALTATSASATLTVTVA